MVTVNFEDWLVGFIEAEGSFSADRGRYPVFNLVQKDGADIITRARDFFGAGFVRQSKPGIWVYYAYGEACWPVRDLCEGNLQMTKKRSQFSTWKQLHWRQRPGTALTNRQAEFKFEDWLIGFIEGEGSFTRFSHGIYPEFSISQDEKEILERIQRFFGCGAITRTGNDVAWQFRINDMQNCRRIRDFCQNKLQLEKRRIQFEAWKNLKWVRDSELQLKTVFIGVKADGTREVFDLKM
jgi:hypothetical protein